MSVFGDVFSGTNNLDLQERIYSLEASSLGIIIAIDALQSLLIDKGIITKEEIDEYSKKSEGEHKWIVERMETSTFMAKYISIVSSNDPFVEEQEKFIREGLKKYFLDMSDKSIDELIESIKTSKRFRGLFNGKKEEE